MTPVAVRVTFVLYKASPLRGMERSAAALADAIEAGGLASEVRFVVLRGAVPQSVARQRRLAVGLKGLCSLIRGGGDERADVIVVVGTWAAAAIAPVAPRLARRSRLVVWEHSILRTRLPADRRLRLLSRAARRAFSCARDVVAVSEPVAACVQVVHRREATVIPNLIVERGSRRGEARTTAAGNHLVAVGSLGPVKNHSLVIRALRHLPGWRLSILGDGPLRRELQQLSEVEGVDDRVVFLGESDDVPAIYRTATVLACPSLSETFGLVLFEAAAARVPVAALDVEAVNDVVPRYIVGELLAPPFSPERYASMISAMVEHPAGPEEFDAAEIRRRDHFDPDVVVDAWQKVLGCEGPDTGWS